ncbi:MAG: RNA polymerase sigma factor [Acidobacteriota bacterium]
MDGTLQTLVGQAADGNREAFSRLVEAEWDRLVRLARSVVGDADAEDLVQDALIRAWRKLAGLRRPEAFPTWIARVVLRRCFRHNRRPLRLVALDDAPEPRHRPSVDAGLDVERLLSGLAPRQRAVMHLTAVEGLSDSEIAGLLDITAASVRSHRRRARQAIERRMAPRAAAPAGADPTPEREVAP